MSWSERSWAEVSEPEERAITFPFFFTSTLLVVSSLLVAAEDLYLISNVRAEPGWRKLLTILFKI